MPVSTKSLSKSAALALVHVHLTGELPKGVHHDTAMTVYRNTERKNEAAYREWLRGDGPIISGMLDYKLIDDIIPEIESHPQVKSANQLIADGWKLDVGPIYKRYKRQTPFFCKPNPQPNRPYATRGAWIDKQGKIHYFD